MRGNGRFLDSVLESEVAVNNATAAPDPYTECNVILLPFLVFAVIIFMILFVMCKYKICGKQETEEEETKK